MTETTRIALMCVQNAGRSQMATAYAERERAARGLEETVEILTGGTHPADEVHDVVVEAMAEEGFDLSGRTPRKVTEAELESCDYVATMGCSTLDLDADAEVRDWDLSDPHGRDLDEVHEIREDVKGRVTALFDEIEGV
ncbi:low molecular weight phosphatase family protein [Salinilacihabitans rarus]|uniref:arsenate-mycothiol transferase ArsC n=1 Tax=Salinilacihabitans rarus TaxID=2961596 RepID=UPI0020C933CF|nr:low molecular weight phosphatase family protein [Salinilacihabitans rarus]